MKTLDITDITTVATRLRRLTTMKPAVFVESMSFKSDLVTLLDLIDQLEEKNERSV